MACLITWPSNQSLPTCVFLKDIAESIVQSETDLFSASPTTFTQPLAAFIDKYPSLRSVEYFFSMMGSEHHTGMHSFHNILISKSALVFLEHLQGKTPFLICISLHT